MENKTTINEQRDFSTISPSAKSLLLLKGTTGIPFAKEAASIISRPGKYEPDFSSRDFIYWVRVLHFEMRYQSIDYLLTGLATNNILELSSGFSFRGLHNALERDIHYIDTDLENVIETKRRLVLELYPDYNTHTRGKLELLPLNALDEKQFVATTASFGAGDITVVNEGLLVYLNMEEKRKLCSNIRTLLKERGGYWITADIYTKIKRELIPLQLDDKLSQFFEEHNIEENKFDNFDAARDFFESEGFILDKEAPLDFTKSTSLKYFLQSISDEQKHLMQGAERMQATWRLRLAE